MYLTRKQFRYYLPGVMRSLLIAGIFYLLYGSSIGLFIRGELALPVSFKARKYLKLDPTVHPRLKIFSIDDKTTSFVSGPDLSLQQWQDLIVHLAGYQPAAIYVDKVYSIADRSMPSDEFVKTLQSLPTPVGVSSFYTPSRLRRRSELNLDSLQLFTTQAKIGEGSGRRAFRFYGPDPAIVSGFKRIGHGVIGPLGLYKPMVSYRSGAYIPHLSFFEGGKVSWDGKRLKLDNTEVPLSSSGQLFPDYIDIGRFFASTTSLKKALTEINEAGSRQLKIKKNDIILILPRMYTGGANFMNSPVGMIPGHLVMVTAFNSNLNQKWLTLADHPGFFVVIAWLLAIFCSYTFASITSWGICFGLISLVIPILGIGVFVYLGWLVPWLYTGLAFISIAIIEFYIRSRATERSLFQVEKDLITSRILTQTGQMLAHDVRRPFASVLRFIERVSTIKDINEVRQVADRYLPMIKNSTMVIEELIEDLLTTTQDRKFEREKVSVGEILEEALCRNLTYDKWKNRVFVEPQQINLLMVNRSQIIRAITNIVSNALEEMTIDDRLDIAILPKGSKNICLEFTNTGSYLDEEQIRHVFEVFYTSGKAGGTGLGLAIVNRVVQSHGGDVYCQSRKSPPSVTFGLVLPAAADPDTYAWQNFDAMMTETLQRLTVDNTAPQKMTIDPNLDINIWVVEDDIIIQDEWVRYLNDLKLTDINIALQVFNSPVEVMDHLGSTGFQNILPKIVVLDYYFGMKTVLEYDIIDKIRKSQGFDGEILLSSSISLPENVTQYFDNVIAKEPSSLLPFLKK